jgi:hypothetical protein
MNSEFLRTYTYPVASSSPEYFKNRQDYPSASAMIQQRGKLTADCAAYL